MCFRKNVSYEILRAVADREEGILKTVEGTKKEFPSLKIIDYAQLASKVGISEDELKKNVNRMVKEKLLLPLNPGRGYEGKTGNYIDGIRPEGRVFLDRLENNRWQRRVKDWIIGGFGTILLALALKKLGLS